MSDVDSDSSVLGVILIVRHGDRDEFVQNPVTFDPSHTIVTPLGLKEEFITGQYLRSVYLDKSSPSHIHGIHPKIAHPRQIEAIADAAAESSVIVNSAQAFIQGLYPPTDDYSIKLANGTKVVAPLGGQQFTKILTALHSLEGWLHCGPFIEATKRFYQSDEFKRKERESAGFFKAVAPFLEGRVHPVNLENMWNIFDFLNVNFIHNAKFRHRLPPTLLAQARTLVSFQQAGIFTSPHLDAIENIGFREMLPGILRGIERIADKDDPLKIFYNAIAYKSFFTIFRMTNAVNQNPKLTGLVDFPASIAIEVRKPSHGKEPVLRLQFKNGTHDAHQHRLNWFNTTGDIPVSTFVDLFAPVAVNNDAEWCDVCNNHKDRGCNFINPRHTTSQATISDRVHKLIGPAGFHGEGLTLFVALMLAAFFLGMSLGSGRSRGRRGTPDSRSVEQETKT